MVILEYRITPKYNPIRSWRIHWTNTYHNTCWVLEGISKNLQLLNYYTNKGPKLDLRTNCEWTPRYNWLYRSFQNSKTISCVFRILRPRNLDSKEVEPICWLVHILKDLSLSLYLIFGKTFDCIVIKSSCMDLMTFFSIINY